MKKVDRCHSPKASPLFVIQLKEEQKAGARQSMCYIIIHKNESYSTRQFRSRTHA